MGEDEHLPLRPRGSGGPDTAATGPPLTPASFLQSPSSGVAAQPGTQLHTHQEQTCSFENKTNPCELRPETWAGTGGEAPCLLAKERLCMRPAVQRELGQAPGPRTAGRAPELSSTPGPHWIVTESPVSWRGLLRWKRAPKGLRGGEKPHPAQCLPSRSFPSGRGKRTRPPGPGDLLTPEPCPLAPHRRETQNSEI